LKQELFRIFFTGVEVTSTGICKICRQFDWDFSLI